MKPLTMILLAAAVSCGRAEPREGLSVEGGWVQDLGRVGPGLVSHTIRLRNDSPDRTTIEAVWYSCGCMASDLRPGLALEPWGSTDLAVKLSVVPGQVAQHAIAVTYVQPAVSAGDPQMRRLSFRFVGKPSGGLQEPNQVLDLGTIPFGQATETEVDVVLNDDHRWVTGESGTEIPLVRWSVEGACDLEIADSGPERPRFRPMLSDDSGSVRLWAKLRVLPSTITASKAHVVCQVGIINLRYLVRWAVDAPLVVEPETILLRRTAAGAVGLAELAPDPGCRVVDIETPDELSASIRSLNHPSGGRLELEVSQNAKLEQGMERIWISLLRPGGERFRVSLLVLEPIR